MMIDELLDERSFAGSLPERQKELIAEHCKEIVELIETSHSPGHAASIVDRACDAFGKECASTLVRNALSAYLEEKQKERWKSRL